MAAINQRRDASESRNARPETPSDPQASVGDTPTLSISREKVCYIIFKAREFDVKDLPTFPDDGSNPADEGRIGLGRLPGDIVIERDNVTFYVPLMTCLILSLVFSLVLWLVNR